MFEKPNWQEADQLAIYTAHPRSLTRSDRGGWRTWTQDHQIASPAAKLLGHAACRDIIGCMTQAE